MKFQDLLNNTNVKRSELKPSFNTGETPTQQHFHTLIDGLYLAQDDSLYKDKHSGLGIIAATPDVANSPDSLTQNVLMFYDSSENDPLWTMNIKDGFHISDVNGNDRLSITNTSQITIGKAAPVESAALTIKDTLGGGWQHLALEGNTENWCMGIFGGGGFYIAKDGFGSPQTKLAIVGDNVGIGTNTPWSKLDVKGSLRVTVDQVNNSEHMELYYQLADVNETKYSNVYPDQYERALMFKTSAYLDGTGAGGAGYQFWTYGVTGGSSPNYTPGHIQAMVIRRDGNVGIGTSSPSEKLNVYNGNIRLDNGFIRFDNTPSSASGITGYGLVFYRDSQYYNYNTGFGKSSDKDVWFNVHEGSFKFLCANSDRLTINLRSNTNAYYVIDANGKIASSDGTLYSSDERYKKGIETITPDILSKLEQVRGTTFQWRTEEFEQKNFSEGTKTGFIAQELKEVFPDLVNEGADGYLSINYTGLIPILVEAVKDLGQKNRTLEERVSQLEK